jgi:hypothetical protein
MTKGAVFSLCLVLAGCADRPLYFPGTAPGENGNGPGGGNGSGNGSNGSNGSDPNNPNGSNGGMSVPPPRLLRPASTATVSARRPHLLWDMTGVPGDATVELCADRACSQSLGSATVDGSGAAAVPDQDLASGVVFWRVTASSGSSATWEFFVSPRGVGTDGFWSTTLDLDGDGVPDTTASATNGNVAVYLGGAAGLGAPAIVLASPDGAKVNFGYTIASAGDLDGDGYGDLAVGECGNGVGRVHVYFGGPGGPDPAREQAIDSPDKMGGFGCRLAGAGDLDADGYADLAVGRVGNDFGGGLYVFRGGAGGPETTTTRIDSPDRKPSQLAYSLAGVGDLDGDGYADLVATEIDADDQSGQAHIYLGGPDGVAGDRVVSLASPDEPSHQFGASVAALGDADGDGWPDFVVGSPVVTTSKLPPKAHLYRGGPGAISASMGSVELDTDGTSGFANEVEGGGDLDGDGFADVVISSRGTLVLFRGGASIAATGQAVAAAGQGITPRHLVVPGDLDHDGRADLLVSDGAGVEALFGATTGLTRSGVRAVGAPGGLGFAGTLR